MNINAPRLPLIVAGLLGFAAALRLAAWPLALLDASTAPDRAVVAPVVAHAKSPIHDDSVASIVSRDLFRLGRRPAFPAYDPLRLAEQLAPPTPRPVLMLVGIVNGAVPSAVLEGLPGLDGSRVLKVGDVVSGLQVKQISNGRVVIIGMDTSWVLQVREPWKP